jgi:hypothetical protein
MLKTKYTKIFCTKKNQTALIIIPKNASSTIKQLKNPHWYYMNDKISNIVVFLRDPIDRWVSGWAQAWALFDSQSPISIDYLDIIGEESFKKIAFAKIELDGHTMPQYNHIEKIIDDHRSKFFLLNDDGLEKANSYYNLWDKKIPKLNVTEPNTFKHKLKTFLNKAIDEDGLLVNKIVKYYKRDYELIRKHFPDYKFIKINEDRI